MSAISLEKGMLRKQVWSMSKLKMLEECPLQFYLSYLRKLAHMDATQDTTERDLGIAIHYLFEMFQSGYTLKEAYELTKEAHYEIVTPVNWPRIIGMLPHVKKFDTIMFNRDELKPYDYVEPEMKLAVDRDYNPVDFFSKDAYFRGVVDYMARSGSEATSIDFKKGGKGYLTRYHTPQLTSYLLLDYYCNGKYDVGNSYIYYVEAGDFSRGPQILGENIEKHTRPWLDNKIEAAIVAVENEGYFKYNRGSKCKYCDYADLCSAGKRGTSGKLVQYEIESKEIL
jgi:CRISPR/Cas system-associated exonuclease Cas4 (RecB family)